jgi:hypothetical protein
MGANRFGRVLGVSARIAAEKLREKAAQTAAPQPRPAASPPPVPRPATVPARSASSGAPPPNASAAEYVAGSRRLARGAGRFGASIWRPFAHASGVLWLQITGVFFGMFTLFFVVHASQVYRSAGWHDRHVIAYCILAILFGWFAVSSFWRAARRQRAH